ncbi:MULTISPECIES: hypothetical protein [unclassified Sedimentibacter]|uniref:hypothetical protein n=1 Tax=unclassified Sedimentibacter TaxID=2649220 RepID=UPI0027E01B56|nr:hypothetical protein [Sedimentibacter sp. MB35-C1]WMJ78728.1 hypothetical protein RBQ61_07325 [Sedimentibacter sp. MB35-C1]
MNRKLIITPISVYDPVASTQWLTALAKEGWYPQWIGDNLSLLRRGTPENKRYFLVPRETPKAEPPTLEGGTYFGKISHSAYIYEQTLESETFNFKEEWERCHVEWRKSAKRRLCGAICTPFALIVLGLALSYLLPASKFDVQPDPHMKFLALLFVLSSPFLVMVSVLGAVSNLSFLRDCKQKNNRKLQHGVLLGVLSLFYLSGIWHFSTYKDTPLTEFNKPYIALSQIETVSVAPWEQVFDGHAFRDEVDRVESIPSIFCWQGYTVIQDGYTTEATGDEMGFSPKGAPYHYSPNLDMAYFHLTVPALASTVAKIQLAEYRLVNLQWEYWEVDYDGLDFVIVGEADDSVYQLLALGKGGRVAVFRYGGLENLQENIPLLATMVLE